MESDFRLRGFGRMAFQYFANDALHGTAAAVVDQKVGQGPVFEPVLAKQLYSDAGLLSEPNPAEGLRFSPLLRLRN